MKIYIVQGYFEQALQYFMLEFDSCCWKNMASNDSMSNKCPGKKETTAE